MKLFLCKKCQTYSDRCFKRQLHVVDINGDVINTIHDEQECPDCSSTNVEIVEVDECPHNSDLSYFSCTNPDSNINVWECCICGDKKIVSNIKLSKTGTVPFDKALRICNELDENNQVWNIYSSDIKGCLEKAQDKILHLTESKRRVRGSTKEKDVSLRSQQMKWKNKLWEERPHNCEECNAELEWSTHVIHHIVPISEGGEFSDENLQVLCPTCHSRIHNSGS